MGPSPPATINSRGSPFGAARYVCIDSFQSQFLTDCRPVDVSSRDKEVADRLERDREANLEKIAMSRSDSRTGRDRNLASRPQTPPASKLSTQTSGPPTLTSTVRPSLSFANVAAKKESSASRNEEAQMVSGDSQ